ncbi:MAG TPA: hypothetical protein VK514_05295 [Candidatus Acidoferrum sp.]|nr:hypothetical protein [Candidatus Acidoferrum sp.]
MTRKQIAGRVIVAVLLLTAFAFVLDYFVLRVSMLHATATIPFEHLTRNRLLAIKVKNGTYQYELDQVNPTETLTCVHSLFPHFGDQPCWYLKPRLDRPIPIN